MIVWFAGASTLSIRCYREKSSKIRAVFVSNQKIPTGIKCHFFVHTTCKVSADGIHLSESGCSRKGVGCDGMETKAVLGGTCDCFAGLRGDFLVSCQEKGTSVYRRRTGSGGIFGR